MDLNTWGNVKFVSGKITTGRHIPTVAYLTNHDNDILFDFTWAIPENVDIIGVPILDVNKDGLNDIIIIYGAIDGFCSAIVFTQSKDGAFNVAVEMSSL